MRKLNCILLGAALSCLVACGKTGSGTPDSGPSQSNSGSSSNSGSGTASAPNGSVVGPCTLEGGIRSFKVICTKDIHTVTFKGITNPGNLQIKGVNYNGTIYDLDIEVDAENRKIVHGSEKLVSEIEFTLNFTDSSTASVTLR